MAYIGGDPNRSALPVTSTDLDAALIADHTNIGAEPAAADELLLSDAGVLKAVTITNLMAAGGKILQVVVGAGSTEDSSTSSTFAAGTVSATITPASSSNKIAIVAHNRGNAGSTTNLFYDLSRAISGGATTHNVSGESRGFGLIGPSTDYAGYGGFAITHLDSPSTTAAVTYKFAFRNGDNSNSVTIGQADEGAVILCMEVSA